MWNLAFVLAMSATLAGCAGDVANFRTYPKAEFAQSGEHYDGSGGIISKAATENDAAFLWCFGWEFF